MHPVKQYAPLAVLAAAGWLVYANWKLEATLPLAQATACGAGACAEQTPLRVERDPFKHEYAWRSGAGQIAVTCRRGLILLGAWSCKPVVDQLPGVEGRDDLTHYPHQTERGVD
jgi:hypothetical protein